MGRATGVIARVSKASPGSSSTDEQEAACRAACAANGWVVREPVYGHTGSASRFAKKGNPQWDRLLRDLPGLDAVVMWEPSRGSRKLTDWSTFLDACQARGILVHIVTHGRTYDLSNSRDMRSLQEDGVDSQYESEKTSTRVRRSRAAAAGAGKPTGQTPYGYRREHDVATGRLTRQYPEPAEAEVVRRIIRDVAARIPMSVTARALESEGIPPPGKQKQWYRVTVRRIAENPAYAARLKTPEGHAPGTWEAVVTDAEFSAAQRVLRDIDRDLYRGDFKPGSMRYLLTSIAMCAVCLRMGKTEKEARLVAKKTGEHRDEAGERTREAVYRCRPGHMSIPEAELDGFVEPLVLAELAKPGVWERLGPAPDAEVAEAREAAESLRDKQREIEASIKDGTTPVTAGGRMLKDLERDIRAAQQHADRLAAPSAAGVWPNADRWYMQPLPFKRFLVRELLGRIEVGRRDESPRICINNEL